MRRPHPKRKRPLAPKPPSSRWSRLRALARTIGPVATSPVATVLRRTALADPEFRRRYPVNARVLAHMEWEASVTQALARTLDTVRATLVVVLALALAAAVVLVGLAP